MRIGSSCCILKTFLLSDISCEISIIREWGFENPYTSSNGTKQLEIMGLVNRDMATKTSNCKIVSFPATVHVLSDFRISMEGQWTERGGLGGSRFLLWQRLYIQMLGKLSAGNLVQLKSFLVLMSLSLSYEVLLLFILFVMPMEPIPHQCIKWAGLDACPCHHFNSPVRNPEGCFGQFRILDFPIRKVNIFLSIR